MRFSRASIAIVLLSSCSVNAVEPINKQRTSLKKYVADQLLRQQQTNDRSLASLDDSVYNDMPSIDSTACQQCDSVMKSYIPKVDHRMMASKQDDDNIIQCIANFLVTMIQVIAIVIQLPFILIANAANECLEDASLCANLLYTLIVAFPYAWVIVFPQYVLFALNNCGALGNFRRRDLQVDESDFDATTTFQRTIIDVMESLKVNDKNDNDDNELVHNFVTNEIKRSLALMVDTLHNENYHELSRSLQDSLYDSMPLFPSFNDEDTMTMNNMNTSSFVDEYTKTLLATYNSSGLLSSFNLTNFNSTTLNMTGSTSIMALLMGGGAHDSKNNNTTNYMSKDAQDDLQKNLLLLSESLKGLSGNNTPATSFDSMDADKMKLLLNMMNMASSMHGSSFMDSNGGMDLMSMMNMPGFHNRLLQSAVVNQNNEKDVAGCTVREMFVCQTNYIVENNIFVVVENNDNN